MTDCAAMTPGRAVSKADLIVEVCSEIVIDTLLRAWPRHIRSNSTQAASPWRSRGLTITFLGSGTVVLAPVPYSTLVRMHLIPVTRG